MSHRNARLTVHGRRLLVDRVRSGRPVAHVAAEMGISRPTAHKWLHRFRQHGESGLRDRSSRPCRTPHRTPAAVEARVCHLRQQRKLGPARIGPVLGMPASTVHRILVRHGLNRLAWLDRPTGTVIRRYERDRPGELVHVDVKKLGRIPDGGGHKVHGRQAGRPIRGMGFDYVHSAVDDHSGLNRLPGPPTRCRCPEKGVPGRAEPGDHGLGRSRGGLSTKVHLVSDSRARPLAFHVTSRQAGDAPAFAALMMGIRVPRSGSGRPRTRPDAVLADRAYSSRAIRGSLRRRGIRAVIPQPSDQVSHRLRRGRAGGRPPAFDAEAYKQRNAVERCINRLKHWRGLAMRTDKLAIAYQAALHLAAILIWVRR